MPSIHPKPDLEAKFAAAADASFRARTTVEYRRVAAWAGKQAVLDNASILDFGCGEGAPAASFALRHPQARVVGYDITPVRTRQLQAKFEKETGLGLPGNLEFSHSWEKVAGQTYDLIYAWSVLEHIAAPAMGATLARLRERIAPGGCLFVNCEPLFFSPHGSHLRQYLKTPWRHLRDTLSELRDRVISEVSTERNAREWEQFTSLNRYTHVDLKHAFDQAGFQLLREHLSRTSEAVPPELLHVFHEQVLLVEGAQFLLVPAAAAAPTVATPAGEA